MTLSPLVTLRTAPSWARTATSRSVAAEWRLAAIERGAPDYSLRLVQSRDGWGVYKDHWMLPQWLAVNGRWKRDDRHRVRGVIDALCEDGESIVVTVNAEDRSHSATLPISEEMWEALRDMANGGSLSALYDFRLEGLYVVSVERLNDD